MLMAAYQKCLYFLERLYCTTIFDSRQAILQSFLIGEEINGLAIKDKGDK